ncbi:PRTRC system protein C [Curvibacter sp. APW13]|uniref:PRTRC system protein C n=1 Tax=Curvibacter sp. APW13 TaxID=3077236 RepID=UPI0028DE54F5|nr:PRTRC system protein C [Curvibacter sp. APW13]MDT8992818.1 PRTRC system protein C [Curvibacter sp. APW13]
MAITTAKRTIQFEGRNLQDIPGMNAEQMRQHYANIYPELSTATVQEEVTPQGITITYTTGYKSKG